MDTPFKWVKQVPSHFGGTAQGVAMSWPGHINDVGGIRRQFPHHLDRVPTPPRASARKSTVYTCVGPATHTTWVSYVSPVPTSSISCQPSSKRPASRHPT